MLASLCSWSLCFLCLSSCGAQATQPPWLARSPSPGRVFKPCPPCCDSKCRINVIQKDKAPAFTMHFGSHLSADQCIFGRKVKKKNTAFSLTDGILKYPPKGGRCTFQLFFRPHKYTFQVLNHSLTMYK